MENVSRCAGKRRSAAYALGSQPPELFTQPLPNTLLRQADMFAVDVGKFEARTVRTEALA
jgi:hypothetical protein